MSEIIVSMSKLGGIDLGSSAYSVQIDFQGDGERGVHNKPHFHVYFKSRNVAEISLDDPNVILAPSSFDQIPGEHRSYVKVAQNKVKSELSYYHYVWDKYSRQNDYLGEYSNNLDLQNYYNLKHNRENLTRPVR